MAEVPLKAPSSQPDEKPSRPPFPTLHVLLALVAGGVLGGAYIQHAMTGAEPAPERLAVVEAPVVVQEPKAPPDASQPSSTALPADAPPDPPLAELVEAPAVDPDGWQLVIDHTTIVGEWGDPKLRPMPLVKVVHKKPGSKTPFNVYFQTGTALEGGCGFYESGDAFCAIHDKDHKTVPVSKRLPIRFGTQGKMIRLTIGKRVDLTLLRVKGG